MIVGLTQATASNRFAKDRRQVWLGQRLVARNSMTLPATERGEQPLSASGVTFGTADPQLRPLVVLLG